MGNNVNYALEGLIPDDVLVAETGIVVPVVFSLQVHGLDYPYYEFSQMAPKSVFFTRNAANRRPAPTTVPVADATASTTNDVPHIRAKAGLALVTSPPPMRIKGQGLGQESVDKASVDQGPGLGPGLDYGVGAHGESITSALTHATGIGSNHHLNNGISNDGSPSKAPTEGAGIKNKVLAGLMKQRTEQGSGLGSAEVAADALGHAQEQGLGQGQGQGGQAVKKRSKLQELLHPTIAPAAAAPPSLSESSRQVADAAAGASLSEDDELAAATESPSKSPSHSRSDSQSKSPSKSRSGSPSKSPSKAAAASVSSNPMARIVTAAANTMTLMDDEVGVRLG